MEYNNLDDVGLSEFHREATVATYDWSDKDHVASIVRIRYLTDPGCPFWDLSYCYGRDHQGRKIRITGLPHMLRRGVPLVNQLVEAARKDNVYLKGLCGGNINDVLSYLNW